jgi:hypothetical protein
MFIYAFPLGGRMGRGLKKYGGRMGKGFEEQKCS